MDVKRKKNLLILADTLEVYGGAERHVLDLAKHLDKERYNIFVSSLIPGGDVLKEIAANGAQVQLFPVTRIYSIFGIIKGFEFMRFLKKHKIDILMTLHFGSDVWGTIFGRLAGVPIIISNRRDSGFWKKRRHIISYKLINGFVDAIITNSYSNKERVIEDEAVRPEKIKVIHGAVDVGRFKPSRTKKEIKKSLGIPANNIVAGAVGNFNPIKGHSFLIEAFAEVVKKVPDARLVLVGDGPLKESLQLAAYGLQLKDKVTFLGSRNDIPDILSIMDICVLPSLSEGLSNALMEYMTAGKPIIATNVGGNPELIEDGVSGMLVEPGRADAIEKALTELMTDEEKAHRFAKNARKQAENELDMSAMVKKYENILSEQSTRKILHLISSNGLFGAERVLLDVARFNQQHEADVIVGAIKNSHHPHTEVIEEARKIGLKSVVFDSSGKVDFGTIGAIKKYIQRNNINVIHTHNYKSDILGFLATRFTKTRWIATNHVWHGTDSKLRIYEMIDSFVLKFADTVIAVSEEIRNALIKKGIRGDKIEKIDNGIDISGFNIEISGAGLRDEFGIKRGEVVISAVGRLSPEKGHAIFLEAAEKIAKKRANVKFLVIGDGPLKDSLQAAAHNRQLEGKVIFTGIRNDIPQVLSISDIFVSSSYVEGLPLTILEAMSARLPVVATRTGAVPQVIENGINGILVDCGDAEGLANEIDALISDKERRKELADEAYKSVCKNFSLERMGREYSDVYEEVLA